MPFNLVARVTAQAWNDRGGLVDLGETAIEVADRVMKLSADKVRALDQDPELRESMVAERVKHKVRRHDGPVRVVLRADDVAAALGAAMGRPRFAAKQLTDTHLRRMRRLLATELREIAHRQATHESDLRLRTALAALQDLTNGELNAAVRQERARRQTHTDEREAATKPSVPARDQVAPLPPGAASAAIGGTDATAKSTVMPGCRDAGDGLAEDAQR